MKTLGNVLWFIFTGLVAWASWALAGILLCITLIGIPFGIQCFKMAGLVVWPFGRRVDSNFAAHPIANILWILLFGWEMAVGFVISGLLWSITIIGIPFGKQCFKLAHLSFFPFGAQIQ